MSLGIAGFLLLFALAGLSSAYYDYPYESSYSYISSRSEGYGPFVSASETLYNRQTSEGWIDGTYVKRNVYVREVRERPNYYSNNYGYNYNFRPMYQNYFRPDYSYGNRYAYNYGNYQNYNYGNSYRYNW